MINENIQVRDAAEKQQTPATLDECFEAGWKSLKESEINQQRTKGRAGKIGGHIEKGTREMTRNIIIGKSFIGFVAMRDEFDLGDKIGYGNTELEALENLLFLEQK